MKVAFCLYGQPRDYKRGFEVINKFVGTQQNTQFDFFFHAWTLEKGGVYPSGSWRNLGPDDLAYNENMVTDLKNMYKPVLCLFETQIVKFNPQIYVNSLVYENTTSSNARANVDNVFSQMYSRNKVRDILKYHIESTGTVYNCVICCRFDYKDSIELDLALIDCSKVYAANIYSPRKIISDNLLIIPTDVFVVWFDFFSHLNTILTSREIFNDMKRHSENLVINPEEMLFANYLFHFKDEGIENLRFIDAIKFGL
jgi:hypothetical protein